jgi:hypothetical protein
MSKTREREGRIFNYLEEEMSVSIVITDLKINKNAINFFY